MRAFLLTMLAALAVAPMAHAQTVITSAGPEHVSVTLYRGPYYRPGREIDRDNPQGYALITERRTIALPAGPAVIRFEGVAGNILPESALIGGLPDGVQEKNLDASLLSPRSLFDRALGRRVMIRRTDQATGKVTLQQATIRSSADGAAVLQIGAGFADLKCSGLPEMLVYDGVPPGLSAKPTLSVRTDSKVARTVTLTLSYLAGGFDWQADYIVAMRPDGRSADMFAWITLASTDVTSFVDADTQVVAGELNRDRDREDDSFGAGDGDLTLKCWPLPNYDLDRRRVVTVVSDSLQTLPVDEDGRDIIVTGSIMRRAVANSPVPVALLASAESLGDLKLYRFPRRVTVASNAQKQVAMLSKPSVKLWPIYRSEVRDEDADTTMVLRGKNVVANGLGVALPGGKVAVFSEVEGRSLMIGESSVGDKTVGEEIEFELGEPGSVDAEVETLREKGRKTRYELTVTNANPWPIDYEAKIAFDDGAGLFSPSAKLGTKDGVPLWTTRVPANGTAKLSYSIRAAKDTDDE
ncbi:hypothetical protein [Sphingomonas bacterium]|uniref:DUF4139 domain-containing protein n=1 Tax=Sphingomonas bacterium TaxID=1895847 RepID=UPI0026378014|nr:hypothetical protein [Sphingomonas bacterium]MDB5677805.1 hypothetical protein [Sphingomonas bacterium]